MFAKDHTVRNLELKRTYQNLGAGASKSDQNILVQNDLRT